MAINVKYCTKLSNFLFYLQNNTLAEFIFPKTPNSYHLISLKQMIKPKPNQILNK